MEIFTKCLILIEPSVVLWQVHCVNEKTKVDLDPDKAVQKKTASGKNKAPIIWEIKYVIMCSHADIEISKINQLGRNRENLFCVRSNIIRAPTHLLHCFEGRNLPVDVIYLLKLKSF